MESPLLADIDSTSQRACCQEAKKFCLACVKAVTRYALLKRVKLRLRVQY